MWEEGSEARRSGRCPLARLRRTEAPPREGALAGGAAEGRRAGARRAARGRGATEGCHPGMRWAARGWGAVEGGRAGALRSARGEARREKIVRRRPRNGRPLDGAVQGGEGLVQEGDDAAPRRGDLPGGEVAATVLRFGEGIDPSKCKQPRNGEKQSDMHACLDRCSGDSTTGVVFNAGTENQNGELHSRLEHGHGNKVLREVLVQINLIYLSISACFYCIT